MMITGCFSVSQLFPTYVNGNWNDKKTKNMLESNWVQINVYNVFKKH
jgi:hypothetical protein